jgi:hypothetical protein
MGCTIWNQTFFFLRFWDSWSPISLIFLMLYFDYSPRRFFKAWYQSIPWEGSWKLPDISYFTDLRQNRCAKNISKTVLKTRLKTKETTFTLISWNTLWSLSQATQRGNFQKSRAKLSKNHWFFSKHKFVHFLLGCYE